MTTYFAWFLIVSGPWNSGLVSYSPPLYSLEDCHRAKEALHESVNTSNSLRKQCVRLQVVK